MPGKHVHFVDLDAQSTPSSTFSPTLSSTSSPGPMTPPTVWYSPLPQQHKSSPYTAAAALVPVHLHPLLARTPGHGAPLHWDVSAPADTAVPQLRGLPAHLTDALVAEPATNPPLPSLALICDYLPWTLTVTPTPHALWSAPYVTVGDVLHALYRALRLGVTDPELAVLEPALQDRVRDAYVRRYRRVHGARERDAEKAKYIKRVDFLRDHTAFHGLSCVPGGLPAKGLAPGTVWALHVARP